MLTFVTISVVVSILDASCGIVSCIHVYLADQPLFTPNRLGGMCGSLRIIAGSSVE